MCNHQLSQNSLHPEGRTKTDPGPHSREQTSVQVCQLSMLWSAVLNAAVRSRKTRAETLLASMGRLMSFVTFPARTCETIVQTELNTPRYSCLLSGQEVLVSYDQNYGVVR